jgi:hypothetical protein
MPDAQRRSRNTRPPFVLVMQRFFQWIVGRAVALWLSAATLAGAEPAPPLTVQVRADHATGQIIQPVWARMNTGLGWPKFEPFIREVVVMTATGGRPESDIMLSFDAAGKPVYDFQPLAATIDHIRTNGRAVRLVLGNVPSILSDKPAEDRYYYANPCPPRNWAAYAAYIEALFAHLVERYSLPVVASWSFRFMTEPDNRAWWVGTIEEYERLYDVTLTAARRHVPDLALDLGNFMLPKEDWPGRLAQWAAGSTPPRPVRAITLSCYGLLAKRATSKVDNQMGNDPRTLADIVAGLRQAMRPLGELPVLIEEGMLLRDEHNYRLWGGEATEVGAAWYAAVYKVCHDANVARYLSWGFRAGDLKSPSYNLITMYERLEGAARLRVNVTGPSGDRDERYADALAARGPDGTVRVLIFQYCRDRHANITQPVELRIDGLPAGRYARRHWRIDREHSNFFTRWLADSAHLKRHNLPVGKQKEWNGSAFDLAVPLTLLEADRRFWFAQAQTYAGHDELQRFEPDRPEQIEAGSWQEQLTLPANAVSLLELIPD